MPSRAECVKVRSMIASDLSVALGLCHELGYECSLAELETRFERLKQDPREGLFCAVDDRDRPLAFVHLSRLRLFVAPDYVRVAALVVAAESRGRGLGRKLMNFAETWAKDQGVATINLT